MNRIGSKPPAHPIRRAIRRALPYVAVVVVAILDFTQGKRERLRAFNDSLHEAILNVNPLLSGYAFCRHYYNPEGIDKEALGQLAKLREGMKAEGVLPESSEETNEYTPPRDRLGLGLAILEPGSEKKTKTIRIYDAAAAELDADFRRRYRRWETAYHRIALRLVEFNAQAYKQAMKFPGDGGRAFQELPPDWAPGSLLARNTAGEGERFQWEDYGALYKHGVRQARGRAPKTDAEALDAGLKPQTGRSIFSLPGILERLGLAWKAVCYVVRVNYESGWLSLVVLAISALFSLLFVVAISDESAPSRSGLSNAFSASALFGLFLLCLTVGTFALRILLMGFDYLFAGYLHLTALWAVTAIPIVGAIISRRFEMAVDDAAKAIDAQLAEENEASAKAADQEKAS